MYDTIELIYCCGSPKITVHVTGYPCMEEEGEEEAAER